MFQWKQLQVEIKKCAFNERKIVMNYYCDFLTPLERHKRAGTPQTCLLLMLPHPLINSLLIYGYMWLSDTGDAIA